MESRLLVGSKQILEYLQMSKTTFKKFLDLGLPAVLIDNRWYSHKDNLDEFLRSLTKSAKKKQT